MSKYARIRDLREDADLTQKQVAESLFMHLTQYRRYETGEREPPLDVVIALAKKYNVSIDYISGLTNTKMPYNTKFTAEELQWLENFRTLSDMQKGRILERIDMLKASGKRTKK